MTLTPSEMLVKLAGSIEVSDSGCWVWLRGKSNGYGVVNVGGKEQRKAHRVAWELVHGPVPDGLELDHLCRNESCINPGHLEAVTHRENCQRGLRGDLHHATHCPNGHEYQQDTVYVRPNGTRQCKPCRNERKARYRARLREAA